MTINRAYKADCLEFINSPEFKSLTEERKICIVTDRPFNIGYHYKTYTDKLPEDEYLQALKRLFTAYTIPFVVIHYPEELYKISAITGKFPDRVVSWVYNSNTPRQHRDIAYFGVKPIMSQVIQPYKNPTDKRIKARIERGILGGKLYDWFEVNQVKNVGKEKTAHPCQMPLEVMKKVIGVIPKEFVIYDPFSGSGTTLVAAKELGRDYIGTEIDNSYIAIINERLKSGSSEVVSGSMTMA